jgi:hypothetical protein
MFLLCSVRKIVPEIAEIIYHAVMKRWAIFLTLLALAGCYSIAPGEGEISTVPVTNNPNTMPGTMKSSSMPSMF